MRHLIPTSLLLLAVMWTPMSLVAQSKQDMKAVKKVIKQYENALKYFLEYPNIKEAVYFAANCYKMTNDVERASMFTRKLQSM